ncbi:MAG: nucleoside monophosphate kinase [Acidobacteriaceae bacterium]|nr:nucleoside monophosphate kinase [Acidobacteriaceae bacterium]
MPRKQTRCQYVILLGAPGSGKGTQAGRLSMELGIPAISTGDLLRRECRSGSALGRRVQGMLDAGQLVDDDVMNQLVASRLQERDCHHGCILDGYPRTAAQAQFLDALLARMRKPKPLVFDFVISTEELVSRLSRRRVCPECGRIFSIDQEHGPARTQCERDGGLLEQRSDDKPETIRERLRQHERNAVELVNYYRDRDYHRLCATRPPQDVCEELLNTLAANWSTPALARAAAAAVPAHLRA